MDKGVVGAGPFGELAGRVIQLGLVTGCRPGGRLPYGLGFWGERRQVSQAGAMVSDGLLDRRGKVLPEMESVGDLQGLGGGGVGGLGIGAGAVGADDLDFGVGHEPRGRVAASRSGSRSRTWWVSASITTVP